MEGLKKATAFRLSAVLLSLVMMSAWVFTGCSKNALFKCDPDNLAGLKRIEFAGGKLTLFFDEDKVGQSDLKILFDDEDHIMIATVRDSDLYDSIGKDDVKADKDKKTVSITTGLVQATEDLYILLRCDDKELEVYAGEGRIKVSTITYEGECGPLKGELTTTFSSYSQTYDKKSKSWSEPEYDSNEVTIWQ